MKLDDDGYPTDETLEEIKTWKGEDFRAFFAAMKPIWKYSEPAAWCGWHETENAFDPLFECIVHRYELSTGGWSGNESLIGAMESNYILWAMTWVQSRRGGHYIFELRGADSTTKPDERAEG